MSDDGKARKPQRDLVTPRFWLGCDAWAWLRLMLQGRFQFDNGYRHMVGVLTPVSIGHSVFKILQNLIYGQAIKNTRLREDPIFIIGHWRTGTTLLHEFMILDPQHNFPTTHQCMDPNHFLLTGSIMKRWFKWMIGDIRPMDQMAVSWDRPQEDEFALCMMGQPSPYLQIAFPNNEEIDPEAYDLTNLTPRQRTHWKAALLNFLKTISLRDSRRLVLKSPAHSCRIPTLLEMFPKAKFVHIVRNPYDVFPSTMHLWTTISRQHGFQTPCNPGLKERVFKRFIHLYKRLDETKSLIPSGQYHELRYEELIASPIEQMRKIYDTLSLDGFENLVPRLKTYLQQNASYSTNQYKLHPEDAHDIGVHWKEVIDRYGYSQQGIARHKAG